MSKYFIPFLISLFLLFQNTGLSQNVRFSTQQEVDDFDTSITSIQGSLEIFSSVTDLSNLSSITSVGDNLWVRFTDSLTNLNGLNNITTIGGDWRIEDNESLENINGLERVSGTTASILISDNPVLQNLDGIENINTITGLLSILDNPVLQDINGLMGVSNAVGFMAIVNNDSLEDIDALSNITSIGDDLRVVSNNELLNIEGLQNITTVGGRIEVSSNSNLIDLEGLRNLNIVDEDFQIESNSSLLGAEGLENLVSVGENFEIINNRNLSNLDGFQNLSIVDGNMIIDENDSLIDINGLSSIETVGGILAIRENPLLQNLSGFANLTNVETLIIEDNDMIQNLNGFAGLSSITSILDISHNDNLEHIDALRNLAFVGSDLEISVNIKLQNLDGLELISEVFGDLKITTNSSLLNIRGLQNITEVGENFWLSGNFALPDLNGLDALTEVGGDLILRSNHALQNLQGLKNLTSIGTDLIIESNNTLENLIGFNSLTTVGADFSLSVNESLQNLNGLEALTVVAGDFEITRNNTLMIINGLESLSQIQGDLYIWSNENLLSLSGLNNLLSVEEDFRVTTNKALVAVEGLSKLSVVGSDFSFFENEALKILDGFENLSDVGGFFTIHGNASLEILNGFAKLSSIGESLFVRFNNALAICCGVKSIMLNPDNVGGAIGIFDNAAGCNTEEEILISDCGILSSISGCMYWDENQNGVKDQVERSIEYINSAVSPNGIVSYSDAEGCYSHVLEDGEYIINFVPTPLWHLNSDSAQYSVTVNSAPQTNLDFGFIPVDSTLAGSYSSISGITRCFREVVFDFNFRNIGNTIVDGRIQVVLDSATELANFIHPADTILSDKIWEWHYEDLYPGELIQRKAVLQMPGVEVDSIFIFSAASAKTDFHPEIFFKSLYEEPVLCAYDPNDKLVSPDRAGDENYTLFDESLIYTVRFQNTGNDTAFTVVIRDTLDSFLDASTFSVLASSHRSVLRTELKENKYLTFTFEDILLPDSTINFNGSQGYITYTIQPKEGLDENTIIENTASIFFDFNPPVVTNTTQNIMVSCLPTIPIIQYDTIYELNTFELIDGRIVNETGSYTSNFIDAEGCDTLVVITELEVLDCPSPNQNEINVQIAIGETHTLPDGMVVSDAGTYTTELLDEVGCPSEIIVTNLDVLTSTGNLPLDEFVSIFPNPTNTHFDLDIKTLDAIKHQLVLVNIYGQEVLIKDVHLSLTKVKVDHLDSGVYFVHIRNAPNELVAARKLMIVK